MCFEYCVGFFYLLFLMDLGAFSAEEASRRG
jgi:hypothetical protein